MKTTLIAASIVVLLLIGIMVWLAGSVGPETAPTDLRTIDLPDTYGA